MVRQYRLDIHHQLWDEILLLLVKSFARARDKIFLIRHLLTKIALLSNFSVTIQMYCKMRMLSDFWPISCGKSNCSIWQCSRRSSVFQTPKRLVAKTKLTSNKNYLCLRFDAAVHTNLYSSIFLAMCFNVKCAIGR